MENFKLSLNDFIKNKPIVNEDYNVIKENFKSLIENSNSKYNLTRDLRDSDDLDRMITENDKWIKEKLNDLKNLVESKGMILIPFEAPWGTFDDPLMQRRNPNPLKFLIVPKNETHWRIKSPPTVA